jgi:hypothetical protein
MTKQIPGQLSFFDITAQPKTCETCGHFFHYVSGPGEIYHGTACGKDRPLSVDKWPDAPACKYYTAREEAIDG